MMENNEVIIRAAKPLIEEGLKYAQLFDEITEGYFSSLLGKKAHEIMSEAYMKPNNEYSYENIFFAEYQNEIIGMVSGFTKREKQGFHEAIQNKRGTLAYSIMSSFLSRFLGPKSKDDYYIQAIIVDKKMRGKRLGIKLMTSIEEIAIAKGAKTLSLDVSGKNKKAANLYKRQGMGIDSQWPPILFIPPVFVRMTKEL